MTKYLVLNFKSAKLFSDKKTMTDIAPEYGIRLRRVNGLKFKEPITSYQIGNMLAVLFGERPTSTLREGLYGSNEYYRKLANTGFLKIHNYHCLNKKKGTHYYPTEKLSSVKAVYNSYGNSPITWEIIRKNCGNPEIFNELINLFERYSGLKNIRVMSFIELREILSHIDLSPMDGFFKMNGISSIKSYIKDVKTSSGLLKKTDTLITITNGVEDVISFDGQIILPIGEDEIKNLSQSKGNSKLLDGGYVWVEAVKDNHQMIGIDLDEFKKISDISLETNY